MKIWLALLGVGALAAGVGVQQVNAADWSTKFDSLFQNYASRNGLDWKMLKAIAMNESGLGVNILGLEPSVQRGLEDPNDIEGSASSDGKSWGLMQLTIPTARDFDSSATEAKLNDPEFSIRVAALFVAWLFQRFPSSDARLTEWVVKSYNQGAGNSAKERAGKIAGNAGAYWERYQRNRAKLEDT